MVVDPHVSNAKFDREVRILGEQRHVLAERGIFVLGVPVFPRVDILFVPKKPLMVAVPQPNLVPPQDAPPGAITLALHQIPSLAARAFKATFDLTDFDLRAPSLEFRDPWTDTLLTYETMFRAFEYERQRQAHLVLLGDHPVTHKPFLCLRGIREYHEHPQHSGDDWLLYRPHMNLFAIVLNVWRATCDLPLPVMTIHTNGLQISWNTEEKD